MAAVSWRERDGAVEIPLRVRPGAPADGVGGFRGDALKVSVTPPPEDGRANDAVVRVLAKALGVPRGAVTLLAGERSRDKRVRVAGVTLAQARAKLA